MSGSQTQPADPSASSASAIPAAVGSPSSYGNVIMVTPGDNTMTVDGGNQNFVIEYTGNTDGGGGNTLNVTGGNNHFVIKYDYAPGDGSAPSSDGNNLINVDGGNNTFAVVYDYGAAADPSTGVVPPDDTSNVVASGQGGSIATNAATNDTSTGGNVVAVGGGNGVSVGGSNNTFVVANNFPSANGPAGDGPGNGNNDVTAAGGNNTFVVAYDYGASALTGAGTYDFSGLPAAAAPSAGSGSSDVASSAAPASGPPAGAPADAGGSDLAALLAQSPFGALLNLPGVTPETLFGNLGSGGSGANPFGSSASIGSNPFANYPGTDSVFSAAMSAGGPPSGAPATAADSGAAAASPFAAGSTTPASDTAAAAPAAAAPGADSGPGIPADLTSMLAASPFGPLLSLPGVDASNLFPPLSASDASFFASVFGAGGGVGGVPSATSFLAANGADADAIPSAAATGSTAASGSALSDSSTPAAAASSASPQDSASSSGSAMGAPSSADLTALLGQSPFGALLNLPGVTPATLFGNLGSSGGANPFGDSASIGSNPFTNYPGTNSIFSAATNAGNAASAASSAAAPATAMAAPAADASPSPLADAVSTTDSSSGPSPSDLNALLAQSPFGPLLNLPGVDASNLFPPLSASDASFFASIFGGAASSDGMTPAAAAPAATTSTEPTTMTSPTTIAATFADTVPASFLAGLSSLASTGSGGSAVGPAAGINFLAANGINISDIPGAPPVVSSAGSSTSANPFASLISSALSVGNAFASAISTSASAGVSPLPALQAVGASLLGGIVLPNSGGESLLTFLGNQGAFGPTTPAA